MWQEFVLAFSKWYTLYMCNILDLGPVVGCLQTEDLRLPSFCRNHYYINLQKRRPWLKSSVTSKKRCLNWIGRLYTWGRGAAFCWGLRFVDLVVISQNEGGLRSLLCRLGGYIWGLGSATASLCAEWGTRGYEKAWSGVWAADHLKRLQVELICHFSPSEIHVTNDCLPLSWRPWWIVCAIKGRCWSSTFIITVRIWSKMNL